MYIFVAASDAIAPSQTHESTAPSPPNRRALPPVRSRAESPFRRPPRCRGPAFRPWAGTPAGAGPASANLQIRASGVRADSGAAQQVRRGAPERSRRRRRRPPGTPQCDTQSGLSGAGPRRSTAPDRRIARPGDSGPCPLRAPPGGSSLPHSRSGSPGLYLSRRPRRLRRAAPAPPFDPRRPSAARRVAVRGTAGLAAGGRAPAGAQCRPRRRPGPGRPGESQSQTGAWRRAGSGGGLR